MSTFAVDSVGYTRVVSVHDGSWRTVLNIPSYVKDISYSECVTIGLQRIYFTMNGRTINAYDGKNVTQEGYSDIAIGALIEFGGRVYPIYSQSYGRRILVMNGHEIHIDPWINNFDLRDSISFESGRYVVAEKDSLMNRELSVYSLDTRPNRTYNRRQTSGTWLHGSVWTTAGYGSRMMIVARDPREKGAHCLCETDNEIRVSGNTCGYVCLSEHHRADCIYDPRADAVLHVAEPIFADTIIQLL